MWLSTVQWPLDRQKVLSACTEESAETVFKLADHWKQGELLEYVIERTPFCPALPLAAQSAGPGGCASIPEAHPAIGLLILISCKITMMKLPLPESFVTSTVCKSFDVLGYAGVLKFIWSS